MRNIINIIKLRKLRDLCTPAMLYLAISLFAILVALFNRMRVAIVLGKTLFVIFWTLVLNFLCQKGYKNVSWFLVLLPYFLILTSFLMTYFQIREGFEDAGIENPSEVTSNVMQNILIEKNDKKEGFFVSPQAKKPVMMVPDKFLTANGNLTRQFNTKSSQFKENTEAAAAAQAKANTPTYLSAEALAAKNQEDFKRSVDAYNAAAPALKAQKDAEAAKKAGKTLQALPEDTARKYAQDIKNYEDSMKTYNTSKQQAIDAYNTIPNTQKSGPLVVNADLSHEQLANNWVNAAKTPEERKAARCRQAS